MIDEHYLNRNGSVVILIALLISRWLENKQGHTRVCTRGEAESEMYRKAGRKMEQDGDLRVLMI